MSGIGSLYDVNGVLVGQAAGFIALPNTPLPSDSVTVFDETVWLPTTVQLGAPSAGTWTLTLSGGPTLLTSSILVSGIVFNVTASALQTTINAALAAAGSSVSVVVSGTGAVATPFLITPVGPGAGEVVITGSGAGLTGGTFLVTPSPWRPLGATEQGWQVQYNPTVQDIYIEEQPAQVDQEVNTAILQFVANLAEDRIENLQVALNATLAVQAPDSTHFGKKTATLSSQALVRYAVALETKTFGGMPRRWYAKRMTIAANVQQAYRRSAALRMIPATFRSVCSMEEISAVDITANHS